MCWSFPQCFINLSFRLPAHVVFCSNHYVFSVYEYSYISAVYYTRCKQINVNCIIVLVCTVDILLTRHFSSVDIIKVLIYVWGVGLTAVALASRKMCFMAHALSLLWDYLTHYVFAVIPFSNSYSLFNYYRKIEINKTDVIYALCFCTWLLGHGLFTLRFNRRSPFQRFRPGLISLCHCGKMSTTQHKGHETELIMWPSNFKRNSFVSKLTFQVPFWKCCLI